MKASYRSVLGIQTELKAISSEGFVVNERVQEEDRWEALMQRGGENRHGTRG